MTTKETPRYTILNHPEWYNVRPFLRVETYARDGGHRHPRKRLEVVPVSPEVERWLLGLTSPCVECGRPMRPIRPRRGKGKRGGPKHLYLAVSCPLSVRYGCARGRAARDEYERIVEDLK